MKSPVNSFCRPGNRMGRGRSRLARIPARAGCFSRAWKLQLPLLLQLRVGIIAPVLDLNPFALRLLPLRHLQAQHPVS